MWRRRNHANLVLNNILSGHEGPYEHVALRKDGSKFLAEVRARLLPYKGKMVRVSILRDLTEYKRAEQALRDSEERFRLIAEQTSQMIYDLDIATGCIQWAGAVPSVSGYSLEEFQQIDLKAWENISTLKIGRRPFRCSIERWQPANLTMLSIAFAARMAPTSSCKTPGSSSRTIRANRSECWEP